MKNFYQDGPKIKNTFETDSVLNAYLKNKLPKEIHKEIFEHLKHVGNLAAGDWLDWSYQAMAQIPVLEKFDPWGRRIDKIIVSAAWNNLEKAAATEGIVATAYERKFNEYSRIYQMALLYLYSPSSAFYSCPLAMTDGAARTLEIYGDDSLKNEAFKNLISRDSKKFWTSGQWMTEKEGGSDVSQTSTYAVTDDQSTYHLHGTKWFTSATTSQMALALARTNPNEKGNRGLSMFYLELRDKSNHLQKIEVHRLKDKLGTKALPTAELTLHGTPAKLIGKLGEGIKTIATVLNITRVYNSICALGHMRRGLDLAFDYALKRQAFGMRLIDLPLHKKTLDDLELEFKKCFAFTFFVVELLGKEEAKVSTDSEKKLLRALTPLVKLYTAKKAIHISSEVLESFGGAGYVEDTGLPYLLRDAQVYSIWEGTTNVLALDFLKVCEKENALDEIIELINSNSNSNIDAMEVKQLRNDKWKNQENARDFAFLVSEALISSLGC
ncbi:MAG: acyl-CoA dehydrogenase family protein [Pseudobdellovibrio sp.]